MISLEQALTALLNEITPIERTRLVSLERSVGCIAAQNVYAAIDIPPFNRSPLDGYAMRSEDIQNASREAPVYLKVDTEIPAGTVWDGTVKPGYAAKIMTGGSIPDGADCVVKQENTDEGFPEVAIYTPEKPWGNICFLGEDIQKGALIITPGETITYAHLGVLASIGQSRIHVKDRVRCGLISSGDELTLPGEPLDKGKIYNSNLFMLAGRLEQFGMEVAALHKTGDDVDEICEIIQREMAGLDILFTTGGVSVGRKDMMPEVLKQLGAKKLFWRVALKPGTPVLAGVYQGKPILCLSGNPFAAMTNFELIGRPALYKLSGDDRLVSRRVEGTLQDGFPKTSTQRRFVRAIYSEGLVYLSDYNHSSGALMSLIGCNAFIDIPQGTPELKPGDRVELVLL